MTILCHDRISSFRTDARLSLLSAVFDIDSVGFNKKDATSCPQTVHGDTVHLLRGTKYMFIYSSLSF